MAATMRAKKFIISNLYTQMKSHGLTSYCTYNEYLLTVGGRDAISPRAVAKGWRGRWPVVMSQLRKMYPDIDQIVNVITLDDPVFNFDEEIEPKLSGLEALKAMSAKKEDEDGKDF